MAQLELDTTTLATAAADLGVAAEALSLHERLGPASAAGDPTLADAIERQAGAWTAGHRELQAALAGLAAALRQAAEVFEGAERRSAGQLAAAVASAVVRPHGSVDGQSPLTHGAL